MDKELEDILKKLSENTKNKIIGQEIITICYGEEKGEMGDNIPRPVVTLDLSKKCSQFHNESAQTALFIEELKPLFDYMHRNDYSFNLD